MTRLFPRIFLLLSSLLLGACAQALINDVTTGRSPEYPDVEPLLVGLPVQAAYNAAVQSAVAMPNWRSCEHIALRRLHCEAVTPSGAFVDDVWVWVEPETALSSLVYMRSASRVGMGDMGTNARRIDSYLSALRRLLES